MRQSFPFWVVHSPTVEYTWAPKGCPCAYRWTVADKTTLADLHPQEPEFSLAAGCKFRLVQEFCGSPSEVFVKVRVVYVFTGIWQPRRESDNQRTRQKSAWSRAEVVRTMKSWQR